MLLMLTPAGERTIAPRELEADKASWKKIGPCALGHKALYIGSRYFSRRYYIPWSEIRRVFKRIAMSPGGFSGRGQFGTMAYLVVQLSGGKEKKCHFKREAELDTLLDAVRQEHPEIPLHSAQAEKKLAEAEAAERRAYLTELTPEAAEQVSILESARDRLNENPSVGRDLSESAKQKRIADKLPTYARVLGAILGVGSVYAALHGLFGLLSHDPKAVYFLLGGGAVFFFLLSGNLLPNRWNSRKLAQREWDAAVERSRTYISAQPDFPVPAQYAHPIVLERMIRLIRTGRAQTAAEAFGKMKEDLRALNSSVKVSQKEHDEVVAVKPMFLVCDYRDEL